MCLKLFEDQGMLPQFLELARFAHSGLTSNFWGLGCPVYCASPAVGTYIAFLLVGLIAGFTAGIWVAFFVFSWAQRGLPREPQTGNATAPEAAATRRRQRLQGYLYE